MARMRNRCPIFMTGGITKTNNRKRLYAIANEKYFLNPAKVQLVTQKQERALPSLHVSVSLDNFIFTSCNKNVTNKCEKIELNSHNKI